MIGAGARPARWRLDALPAGATAGELRARSRAFATLDPAAMDAGKLAVALDELGELRAALQLQSARVELPLLLDEEDEDAHRRAADLDALLDDVESAVRPFELAWVTVSDERAGRLLADERLARHRHYLERARCFAAHVLSDHDEDLLAARDHAAQDAWERLYEHVTSTIRTSRPGCDPRSLNAAVDDLQSPSAGGRRTALADIHDGVGPHAELLARCVDALIVDRLALDDLRGFAHPRAETDLENDLRAGTVEALLAAVEHQRPLLRRWNETKAGLLGLDELGAADEFAPVPGLPALGYAQALRTVAAAFAAISPDLGELVLELDRSGHIDAQARPRKRGVATCVSAGAATLPFVSLTFDGRPGETLTLAHEIGHAVHYALAARNQTALDYDPSPPVAETAAVFAELLVLRHLGAQDEELRRVAAAQHMDFVARNVFRQAMITRFEAAAYAARAAGEVLTAPRLTDLWLQARRWLHGDAPIATDELGWALVPHYVHHRFYNYAYAFAALTATGLLGRWQAAPQRFGTRYRAFLATGGAASPAQLLTGLGLDPDSSWDAMLAGLGPVHDELAAGAERKQPARHAAA